MKLLQPLAIGERTAPNRVMFGPHETNLAQGRAISDRHVAYYRERAEGGCGTIVVETASVHPSDWPYERCPDAALAPDGWAAISRACRDTGALVLAGLGHSGGQGSSAYSQRELWAPADEPEVNTREVPKIMELEDIDAVVAGFAAAAAAATDAGLAGVEINGGQHSLVRQFLSGLTNRRGDDHGHDRLRFAREVLLAVRASLDSEAVVGLRLSCDELAPWAGITPELAAGIAAELGSLVDYLVVVRGSIFSVAETRPTGHHGTDVNLDLAAGIRVAVDERLPVFAQGSIVDADSANAALDAGACDGVEMTRAQITDPELVAKIARGATPRPCVLCNQRCIVRDNRNPIVSCIAEPRAGYETIDPPVPGDRQGRNGARRPVLVVGAGPAGLEAARVAARSGCAVTVIEAAEQAGGLLRAVARAPGHERFGLLADWLVADATESGAHLRLGERATPDLVDEWPGPVVLATGAGPTRADVPVADGARVLSPLDVLRAEGDAFDALVPASVAVWDPIGNSVGVAVAELLAGRARSVTFVTPDAIAGTLLSLTGDLAGCNVRLQRAGVRIERRQQLRAVGRRAVTIEHHFSAVTTEIPAEAIVDCSPRSADRGPWRATGPGTRVGDAVAARTVGEAIREGRAAGLAASIGSAVMEATA